MKAITKHALSLGLLFLICMSYWSFRTVMTWSGGTIPRQGPCILIDAGHGLPDGGAISCTGAYESEINLAIAQKLEALLKLLGYETKMLRRDENSVYTEGQTIGQKKVSDLKERVRVVNATENGLLLSIHQNTYSDSRYQGAQMFYGKAEGSQALAEALQTAFLNRLNPDSHRQVKKAEHIYLMENAQCPAVLVECGFLSNPEEEARLRTEEYQKRICCVIASALSNYLANT